MSARKEVIGDATIYCGDCFDVLPTLGLSGHDLLLTDPPYGCTENAWDTAIDLQAFWQMAWPMLKENAAMLIFSRQPFTADLIASNRAQYRYELIWHKDWASRFIDCHKMPLPKHENIEVFYSCLPTYNPQMSSSGKRLQDRTGRAQEKSPESWNRFKRIDGWTDNGLRYPKSVIEIKAENDFFKKNDYERHPTQKPVTLMLHLIKTYTNPQGTVLDPFMGAGSTGVAALKCGRKFIGVEKEEKYFDTACYRMEKAVQETSLLSQCQPRPNPRQAPLLPEVAHERP